MSQKQTTSATTTPKPPNARTLSHSQNFYFGGLSGMMATCVVQPIDLIKVCFKVLFSYRGVTIYLNDETMAPISLIDHHVIGIKSSHWNIYTTRLKWKCESFFVAYPLDIFVNVHSSFHHHHDDRPECNWQEQDLP